MKTVKVLNYEFKGEDRAELLKSINHELKRLPETATYCVGITGVAVSEESERPRPVKVRQSAGTYLPPFRSISQECEVLEQQRRYLLHLLTRILYSGNECKLHRSEIATGKVGDLSFLPQELRAYLLNMPNLKIRARIAKSEI